MKCYKKVENLSEVWLFWSPSHRNACAHFKLEHCWWALECSFQGWVIYRLCLKPIFKSYNANFFLIFLIFLIGWNVEFSVRVVLGGGGVGFGGKDGVLNECWDGELFGSYLQSKECSDIGVWVGYFNFYFLFFWWYIKKKYIFFVS